MGKELELEVDTVTLFTDEGEIECAILTTLELNGKEYVALSELDKDGDFSEDVWFYEFKEDPTGGDDHELIYIEDEDEYEQVIDKFDEWLDTCEFEEL
ncbi:MAG: DUF1292 domain-containing protein [Lachnospiraceae bacterium]